MPVGHSNAHRQGKEARFELGVALFGVSMLVYICTAVACMMAPPATQLEAGGVPMGGTGLTCLRATRNADYTTVDVPMGTPFRLRTVVLRMDKVLAPEDVTPALQLFASQVVESETVDCSSDDSDDSDTTACEDVALLADIDFGDAATTHVVRFKYRHHLAERSVAYALPGVGGELFLRGGMQYWLTATHLCYADNDADNGVGTSRGRQEHARTKVEFYSAESAGKLTVSRTELLKLRGDRGAPIAELTDCDFNDGNGSSTDVELFPEQAAVEPEWLRISDMTLYNSEPESVERRRVVAELGAACAATKKDMERDLMLYKLDCEVETSPGTVTDLCRNTPSLPFRRLATASLHIAIDKDSKDYDLATKREETLGNLARLSDATNAFIGSLVKLGMITLASAVVYVRSRRATASSSWLFKHAVRTASACRTQDRLQGTDESFTIVEDGVIGIIAIAARITIAGVRWQPLMQDGQWRVPITEMTAGVVSLLHMMNRYFGFPIDKNDPPVSKLGGATAILDSTCAVMVAFSEAPTMVVSIGRFNPTARLLTALLISLIVATRCAFSAASCGVLWQAEDCPSDKRYGVALVATGVMWAVVQTTALAVVVVDLFVTPSSYSMSRLISGDIFPARMLLFFALMCAGLPRFMLTVRHILSTTNNHVD